jgi:hypothetical protein
MRRWRRQKDESIEPPSEHWCLPDPEKCPGDAEMSLSDSTNRNFYDIHAPEK